MGGLQLFGAASAGVEKAIAGSAGEAGKVLRADDPGLLAALAASGAMIGKSAPGSSLALNHWYIRLNEAETQVIGLYLGQAPSAPIAFDFSGTPADGSVTLASFVASLLDGAVGLPSLRTLVTQLDGTDNLHAPTARAVASGASGVRVPRPPSGSYLSSLFTTKSTGSLGTKETLLLFPFSVAAPLTTTAIAVNVTEAGEGAGQQARLGVYEDDGTGAKPKGSPLWDAGAVSTLSTGVRSIEAEKTWETGRYWASLVLQGTLTKNPTFTTANLVSQPLGFTSFTEASSGLKQTGAGSGALPAIGTLVPNNLAQVLIGLKVK